MAELTSKARSNLGDAMFGLPGQTLVQWEATLRRAIALEPEHISAYCLTYEEDTEFFRRQARGEFQDSSDRFAGGPVDIQAGTRRERWIAVDAGAEYYRRAG